MAKILAFRLWGDYAHFKKYYTTTSPLTFEIPPPPTLIGIISAIIGLDKDEYLSFFQNKDEYKLAICLDKPVKKVRWSLNLIDTKKHFWIIHNRTQIRTEFLKEASYIIYCHHTNSDIYNRLKTHLQNHESVYSISLGLSELLANYEFLGEMEYEFNTSTDWINLNSVLPYSQLLNDNSIDFGIDQEIFKINYPIMMDTERIVHKRDDIIFERNAKPVKCRVKQFAETQKGDKIVFI